MKVLVAKRVFLVAEHVKLVAKCVLYKDVCALSKEDHVGILGLDYWDILWLFIIPNLQAQFVRQRQQSKNEPKSSYKKEITRRFKSKPFSKTVVDEMDYSSTWSQKGIN